VARELPLKFLGQRKSFDMAPFSHEVSYPTQVLAGRYYSVERLMSAIEADCI
jgi:hypothetical protein